MIAYIQGKIADTDEDYIVIEGGTIGYVVYVTEKTVSELAGVKNEIKLHTFLHVKEDALTLYGFLTKKELQVFRLLIGVNGIGPKSALGVLTVLTADTLSYAILSEDIKTLSQAPGIGKKTAQRLIIELKDKLKLSDVFEQQTEEMDTEQTFDGNGASWEATEALEALGYSRTEACRAVREVPEAAEMDTEAILKAALKKLAVL